MRRKRLTITLREDVLKQVDSAVDGSRIRNRSHAIEHLLQKTLAPKVSQALILAGGKGSSLRPYTYEMPKCMLPVAGKPVLEHIIDQFRKNDIRELIVSIGHLGEKIKEHFGDGKKFGVDIKYVKQGKRENGTAQPVLQARDTLNDKEPFIVYYGDVLVDLDLRSLIDFHMEQGKTATVALTSVAHSEKWGMVALQGTRVMKFCEKPDPQQCFSHVISAGIYVFEPEIFKKIEAGSKSLEQDIFPKLAEAREMCGYSLEGKWFDIGDHEIYEKAVKEWKAE